MAGFIDTYRRQWPRVGALLGMAAAGATALVAGRNATPRTLAAVNFGALVVHQYEEYVDPGWFPGQFNHGLFKSETPQNYPLNTNSALIVNTVFAYPFYLAPILFPKKKWLGLAPAIFGIMQAGGHGVIFPRVAGDRYSPGFLASFFLHIPIGVNYIQALKRDEGLSAADVAKGIAYTLGFALVGVAGPNLLGHDKNSPHTFTRAQLGRHTND